VLFNAAGCQYLKKRVEKRKTEYRLTSTGKFRIEIEMLTAMWISSKADIRLNLYYEKIGKVRIMNKISLLRAWKLK
jgi:hypothetical protein